ncbi:DUF5668 domain-containing protein [Pedobacter sp. MC2016-14]|uniref:LiaF transmembrane domain-containing protein n=1 Tax=Pedobacter sp. MC2016-14 TaxID=2897327 RepID=UPI001E59D47C|nr:DUF5668 domain-containing protein [Pedobacter sp. MC2016-14]MCD0488354.1 DUF5668 domain-containing protein [Pedobacter sp. MC2016-14]
MKLNRVIWGIILLFIGGVLLLENFGVIDFYWGNVWRFWPVFLIITGLNILFSRQRSQTGAFISIGVLVVMLSFLFFKGQQPASHTRGISDEIKEEIEGYSTDDEKHMSFFELYHPEQAAGVKSVLLNISGGGTSFGLSGETDSLLFADVRKRRGSFSLKSEINDSLQTLTFKTQERKGKWNIGDGGNDVDFKLNTQPLWEIVMNMGAGEVNFDLSDYKVRNFKFNGGAAAMDIKLGDLLPVVDVSVKTGVADVKIRIPEDSGCRILTKTGLSAKDFNGFTKLDDGTYETPNYASADKKIFINLDGGLSNFEVKRY